MATPTIPNGEEYFFPVIYEGNGAGQRVGKFVPFTDNGTIANSVIFNDNDDAYLARTFSTPTNNKKWTYSVWIKRGNLGTNQAIMSADYDGASYWDMRFNTSNQIYIQNRIGSSNILLANTTRTFEDTSKWYHLVFVYDSDNSTSTSRAILYIDGDIQTLSAYPSSGDASAYNVNSEPHHIGVSRTADASGAIWSEFDGYFAEANFIDGQALTPLTFGVTDTSTGRWIPKTLSGITYGTNGFRLTFSDNSTASALGTDSSGNSNTFSVNGIDTVDQTTDSPTQNFATFSPGFSSSSMLLSEGNLTVTDNANANYESAYVGMPVQSGKYYFEITIDVAPQFLFLGVNNLSSVTANKNQYPGYADGSASFLFHTSSDKVYYGNNGGNYYSLGSATTLSNGDKVGVAYDADTGAFWVAKNNSWLYSGNPSTGANPLFTGYTPNELVYFSTANWYSTVKQSYNFGQRSFAYTPPTDFVALQQDNLPETAKGISGLSWIKERSAASNHQLYDSSRGAGKLIMPSATNAQSTRTDALYKFLKGGYAVGDNSSINGSGDSVVAWNWVANGGSTSSNTDGSITSTVQANTTAGFSIVEWTGDGGQSTVGHGLSSTPEIVIQKNLDSTSDWWFYTTAIDGSYDYLKLNSTAAKSDYSATAPTSTVFTSHGWGTTSMIAYCWHEIQGFSKFSSYIGNGSSDGTFVYLGFKPAFVMVKQTSASGNNWWMIDSKRDSFNPTDKGLRPSTNNAESTGLTLDFLSNGFKLRLSGTGLNGSGSTYFYMAFAEHPFVGDGTSPVTAR